MKLSKPKRKPITLAAIGILSIFFAYLLSFTGIINGLELKTLDLRFALRGNLDVSDSPIIILAIDDQSDESTPDRWPWPRAYYAHVIKNLNAAGAAVIGVDVMLDQSDVENQTSDDSLAAVLSRYDNVVLTGKLGRTSANYSYTTLQPPYGKFLAGSTSWGLAALEADADGFYRRYPVGQMYGDSLLPSFAAEIIRKYNGNINSSLTVDKDFFHLDTFNIVKYDPASMLINYTGPAFHFPYYSFDNVLDDHRFDLRPDYDLNVFDDPGDSTLGIPPGLLYSGIFKDKIVLIGSSMHELHDNFPTPFLESINRAGNQTISEMPGVEIHANAIATILSGNYLTNMPQSYLLLILIWFSAFIFLFNKQFSTLLTAIFSLLLVLVYLLAMNLAFINYNYIMPVMAPVLTIVLSYGGFTLYHYILAQQEKRMLRGAFAYYVPETVIQDLMSNPEKLKLGGEERVISVLFSDVAGFTTISEALKPRELVSLLNEYLTEMTDLVIEHRGIIDKYEGDAIMAEYGVPVPFEAHAREACATALHMQQKLELMRQDWARRGLPELQARVGINTGEVIVGNMGSRDVFDYTVMGDHVNLGARLEGTNKFYGTKIMISEFTYAMVKDDFITRPLDLIRVKGKKKPIEVFELVDFKDAKLDDKSKQLLGLFTRGIAAYRNQKWMDAADIFEYCLKLNPNDRPSQVFHKRCFEYKENPPGEDWDGVTTMTEK